MSSTNRSDARDSHISDYYVTPFKPINELFVAMKNTTETSDLFNQDNNFKGSLFFIDPCAGGDLKNEMSYPSALIKFGAKNIDTFDIREDSLAKNKINYLTYNNPIASWADVVITNPPFNIAEEIINKALHDSKDGTYVIMLLRLNFFGSKKRKEFWKDNMPILTFVHRERISFTNGQTDSIEYMHCIWKVGQKQNYTKLSII